MRELDLLAQYLLKQRSKCLQHGHTLALGDKPDLNQIQIVAHMAEFMSQLNEAIKVLEKDAGRFLEEYLK